MLLRFFPLHKRTHANLDVHTHVRANDRSTNYSDGQVKKRTKKHERDGGLGKKTHGGGEIVEQWGAGS